MFLKTLLILGALLLFLVLLLKWGRTDLFRVKEVVCFNGGGRCSPVVWAGIFNLASQKPLFLLSPSRLEQEIVQAFPQFEKAKIAVFSLRRIEVKLDERSSLAEIFFVPEDGSFLETDPESINQKFQQLRSTVMSSWLVARGGIILREGSEEKDLPRLFLATKETLAVSRGMKLADYSFGAVFEALEELEKRGIVVCEGLIEEKDNLALFLLADNQVFLSLGKDPVLQVDSLQAIFKQAKIEGKRLRIVDLRFNKPVVSFF